MIYVSSSSVKATLIKDAVKELAENGFKNIELSGGTKLYPELESDLLGLKEKYSLNYLCHNYFPPPAKDFVLNIASLDDSVSEASVQHIINALRLSRKLGGDKYAFHAGFLINIGTNEIGKSIQKKELFNRSQAKEKFCNNYKRVIKEAGPVKLYIENNVLSKVNFDNYNHENPLFMTDAEGVREFENEIEFNLLLDVAHLKVSCKTLGLDFMPQLQKLSAQTDYIHISDNDGLSDSNGYLSSGSELFAQLKEINLKGKDITLEVYDNLQNIRKSFDNLEMLI